MVAVGTFQKTRRPSSVFRGTGFDVADGLHIVTNAHVLPEKIDLDRQEMLVIFAGGANVVDIPEAAKITEITPTAWQL